ncbi:MAG: pantetheine-phosphate adenylyltransferase [Puniceicoccales bacterium]|nr:pantetheine-phosphate adenylyltransferase [Puniceicoccales bacterium]
MASPKNATEPTPAPRQTRPPRIAVYPGTFDPLTLGHIDVLRRACRLFDKVILAVAPSGEKKPLFSLDERLDMAREALADLPAAGVEPLHGLTVFMARKHGAVTLIRGLRKFSDFEFEFDLAHTNRLLAPDIETIVLMPSNEQFCTSSTFVKEIALHDISKTAPFVTPCVLRRLREKLAAKGTTK